MRIVPENNLPDVTPASPSLAWLETFAITIALPLLGLWLTPQDALYVYAHFPWLIMAPLLAGIRYGFVYGFTSALALILGIAVAWRWQLLPIEHFPVEYSLGLLIVGMLSGEFCDTWIRRTRRLAAAGDYQRIRSDEFTRAYHLLKVSHDHLEHRQAASTQSLRGSLYSMRRHLLEAKMGKAPLNELGHLMLSIFSNYGHLHVASLYAVNVDGNIVAPALASLGASPVISIADPLLVESLRTGQMTSVRAHLPATQEEDDHRTNLLAAIPIVGVSGHIWAVVAVHEMPFMTFHEDNLKLLAVLGGHMGDILASDVGNPTAFGILPLATLVHPCTADAQDPTEQDFIRQLRRSIEDAHRFRLAAMVVQLTLDTTRVPIDLAEVIVERRRGLDQMWLSKRSTNTSTVLLLMPLTDMLGMEGYLAGLERLTRELYGLSLADAGMTIQSRELNEKDTPDGIMKYLGKTPSHMRAPDVQGRAEAKGYTSAVGGRMPGAADE